MISADQVSAARSGGFSVVAIKTVKSLLVGDVTIEKLERANLGDSCQTSRRSVQRALEVGGVEFTREQLGVRLKGVR